MSGDGENVGDIDPAEVFDQPHTNDWRAGRVRPMLEAFAIESGQEDDPATALYDLIANLLHLADRTLTNEGKVLGVDMALGEALMHYRQEATAEGAVIETAPMGQHLVTADGDILEGDDVRLMVEGLRALSERADPARHFKIDGLIELLLFHLDALDQYPPE